jgi:hypothetical protein
MERAAWFVPDDFFRGGIHSYGWARVRRYPDIPAAIATLDAAFLTRGYERVPERLVAIGEGVRQTDE